MTSIEEYPFLILFDGHCNLCNGSILFIIKRDKKKIFKFCPSQNFKDEIIKITFVPESIIYIEKGTVYRKSSATLRIFKKLGGIYSLAYYLCILIPTFIRDVFYDLIANNRYKWFGKQNQCMIPTENLRNRFLD